MDAAIPQFLAQTSPKESYTNKIIANSRWNLARNVIQAVSRFKFKEVKVVDDVNYSVVDIESKAISGKITRSLSSREYYVRDAINEHKLSDIIQMP